MILKSLSRTGRANTAQLVKYVFKYVLNEDKIYLKKVLENHNQSSLILKHNIRSRSLKGFIREFEENESYRLVNRKDSVKLFHDIISFSDKDAHLITDKVLKDIGKKYITERGENNLYVGAVHYDRQHPHLHIIVSGTQLDGRSSRVSKGQFHHIKLELDRYQKEKYPQLIHSLPEHGRKKRPLAKEEVIKIAKENRETRKEVLCKALESTYEKASSKEQFLENLSALGYQPYYRNDKLQGILYEGEKFRLNRLGYDETVLETLNQKQIEQQQQKEQQKEQASLQELQDLRFDQEEMLSEKIPLEEEMQDSNEIIFDNEIHQNEQYEMDALASIRDGENTPDRLQDIALVEQRNIQESSPMDLRRANSNSLEIEDRLSR